MAGFLYYMPNVKGKPNLKKIDGFGTNPKLGSTRQVEVGPDGNKGVVFEIEGRSNGRRDLGFYPSKQKWESFAKGKIWLSVIDDDKPIPDDLIKSERIPGHYCELEDGNKWLIPVARKMHLGCVLPQSILIDNEGKYIMIPTERYLELQAYADNAFYDFMIEKGQLDGEYKFVDPRELYRLGSVALGTNYQIAEYEITMLKLLTNYNCNAIANLIIDLPSLEETDEKKTEFLDNE